MNPAPDGPRGKFWGDYHFGFSLREAMERRGISVRQHFWPNWSVDDDADAVIVLRGKRRFIPPKDGRPWLLWIISHPAAIAAEEIDGYTVVCPASETFCRLIEGATSAPVRLLRQCTDSTLFRSPEVSFEEELDSRKGLLFVANSRGVMRSMPDWARRTGLWPDIIGREWRLFGLQDMVVRDYVENRDLPNLYQSYRMSLNDHWGDMRHFGIISNRIFDCLACGLPVLSDRFPEIEAVFGDGVVYASTETEFWDAIWRMRMRYPDVLRATQDAWERLAGSYTFDARAEQIHDLLAAPPGACSSTVARRRTTTGARTVPSALMESDRGRPVRLLHVQPTSELLSDLVILDHIEWLGAGIGVGPWEVDMDLDASQFPSERFDVVVLDAHPLAAGLDSASVFRLVAGLLDRLRPSGVLMISEAPSSPGAIDWQPALEQFGQGLKRASDNGYAMYSREQGRSSGNHEHSR